MQAVAAAGTTVHEPVNHFELDIPPDVGRPGFCPCWPTPVASSPGPPWIAPDRAHLEGTIPAATTHPFETHLPGQTHGEGILTADHHHLPPRPRPSANPLPN